MFHFKLIYDIVGTRTIRMFLAGRSFIYEIFSYKNLFIYYFKVILRKYERNY